MNRENEYYPEIFDMDEDLESESQHLMIESSPSFVLNPDKHDKETQNQPSPCGINGLQSPFFIAKSNLEDIEYFAFSDDDLSQECFIMEKLTSSQQECFTVEKLTLSRQEGLFFSQQVLPLVPKESLLSLVLKDAKPFDWQAYQNHRFKFLQALNALNAPFVHQVLMSELIEELFCYHVHHQIKRYRENFDYVLEELIEEHSIFEDLDPGFPGLSRVSTPML